MASAVVRVKRRITDEPFNKFVLNCKRQKTIDQGDNNAIEVSSSHLLDGDTAETRTILKLAATVSADDDIATHLTRLRKSEAQELARKIHKPMNVTAKARQQLKTDAQNHRFKITNCFRSIDDENATNITVLEVVKEDISLAEQGTAEKASLDKIEAANDSAANRDALPLIDDNFVYDLYLVDSGEQPTELDIKNFISIRPFDDLVYQANDETLDDSDVDSDDSNDEANWRNEYPDTDDDFSIGEDDMRRAVEDLNLGSDDDSISSDDSDYTAEPVVHFLDDGDMSAYDYFKKHGRIQSNSQYYRSNRILGIRNAVKEDSEDDYNGSDSSTTSSKVSSTLESDVDVE